jgi:hypothetical protein
MASLSAARPPGRTAPWPQAKRSIGKLSSFFALARAVALSHVAKFGKGKYHGAKPVCVGTDLGGFILDRLDAGRTYLTPLSGSHAPWSLRT